MCEQYSLCTKPMRELSNPGASGSTVCVCEQYSLCTKPMRELSNPGASGSIFYITDDDEYIVKTVQRKEAEFLQKLLPGYYMVFPTHCFQFLIIASDSLINHDWLMWLLLCACHVC